MQFNSAPLEELLQHIYIEIFHKNLFSTLSAAQSGSFELCNMFVFILVNRGQWYRHRPWNHEEHDQLAAHVFWLFREQWYRWRLLCQVGSCYLYGRRRKHFCRRQGTQSPLWQLEEEVWFYSGCGCQIYLESSHVSSLFSYVAMAIFIIVWYPYQGSWLISLK